MSQRAPKDLNLPKPALRPLPSSIVIAGREFAVRLVDNFEDERMGDCDVVGHKIRVGRFLRPEDQWQTLFHECVHAALRLGGLHEVLKEEAEEAVCWNLESLLWPILEFKK